MNRQKKIELLEQVAVGDTAALEALINPETEYHLDYNRLSSKTLEELIELSRGWADGKSTEGDLKKASAETQEDMRRNTYFIDKSGTKVYLPFDNIESINS